MLYEQVGRHRRVHFNILNAAIIGKKKDFSHFDKA